MKKITRSLKLTLQHETLKALQLDELVPVVVGATGHCAHPTTTVLLTGSC